MTSADSQSSPITVRAALCALAASAIASVTAAAVSLAGRGDELRTILGFGFSGVPQSPETAAGIALHNGRLAAGTLVCACLAPRLLTRARVAVDAALVALLALNATAVGLAVGAYGRHALAAHVPLELAALSLPGGAYMQACRQPLTPRQTASVATATALLLIAAAVLETYTPIGRSR